MLTVRLADISGHQLRHHLFNVVYTTLPEMFPLPLGQFGAKAQFRHR